MTDRTRLTPGGPYTLPRLLMEVRSEDGYLDNPQVYLGRAWEEDVGRPLVGGPLHGFLSLWIVCGGRCWGLAPIPKRPHAKHQDHPDDQGRGKGNEGVVASDRNR